MTNRALLILGLLALSAPASARDSLGVYSDWAAFRDDNPSRCYAIAKPTRSSDTDPFASVATWPDTGVRGQLHIHLSRDVGEEVSATLNIGDQRFDLVINGRNAWAADNTMDAAIVAAMRSATRMTVSARGSNGARFSDRYSLSGAATAMDAAVVGCASRG
ncbi:invasion associated locus B family protein [uncultured Erythrobacter sp.]|uniref:invasion associated locus B family protein n=1 Tax=uncultured Erythrobacter sp. TaxID=263913 RepID=UPI00262D57C5|nr:invasion associated locus B family protein [uncultured Erythrobacter sp.]